MKIKIDARRKIKSLNTKRRIICKNTIGELNLSGSISFLIAR